MNDPKTILIGLPSGSGQVPLPVVQSLLQLHKPLPCGFISVERQRIDKARNHMVSEALRQNFDYLFMVDDDNPIPPETLKLMVEDDKDIVIAPILSRSPNAEGKHDLCAFYSKEYSNDEESIRIYNPITSFKEEGDLHKIDAGGTGCILIKRKVLEAVHRKYEGYSFEFGNTVFKKPIMIDGKEFKRRTMSEDAEFCERASDLGFEVWLDERITPLHLGHQTAVKWKK